MSHKLEVTIFHHVHVHPHMLVAYACMHFGNFKEQKDHDDESFISASFVLYLIIFPVENNEGFKE